MYGGDGPRQGRKGQLRRVCVEVEGQLTSEYCIISLLNIQSLF